MAVTLNANTSTGFIANSDTSGVLQLQTGGTAAVSIGTDQSFNFSATGQRITGDFSNATAANRVAFQTSTANGNTGVYFLPNGTATTSNVIVSNASDPTNSALGILGAISSDIRISSAISGTGTYLPMTFYTGGSERVRIDTSGNVGIGITNPGAKLAVVSGTSPNIATLQIGFSGSNNYYDANLHSFRNGSQTEVARIDSSGNLLVGTTTSLNGNTSYSFQNNSSTLNTAWLHNANASDGTAKLVLTSARAANTAYNFIDCGANYPTSFSRQFLVSGTGVIYAQNTTVQSLSDIRTKENIRNSDDGLDVITALRPVRFDFKEGFGNNRKNQLGFIAQEIEPVFPDAVSEWEQGGEAYKSVGPGALIPVLVKAIQEQQAIITSLTDRITALEGTTP